MTQAAHTSDAQKRTRPASGAAIARTWKTLCEGSKALVDVKEGTEAVSWFVMGVIAIVSFVGGAGVAAFAVKKGNKETGDNPASATPQPVIINNNNNFYFSGQGQGFPGVPSSVSSNVPQPNTTVPQRAINSASAKEGVRLLVFLRETDEEPVQCYVSYVPEREEFQISPSDSGTFYSSYLTTPCLNYFRYKLKVGGVTADGRFEYSILQRYVAQNGIETWLPEQNPKYAVYLEFLDWNETRRSVKCDELLGNSKSFKRSENEKYLQPFYAEEGVAPTRRLASKIPVKAATHKSYDY